MNKKFNAVVFDWEYGVGFWGDIPREVKRGVAWADLGNPDWLGALEEAQVLVVRHPMTDGCGIPLELAANVCRWHRDFDAL